MEALHTFNHDEKLCRGKCLSDHIHSWLFHLSQRSWIVHASPLDTYLISRSPVWDAKSPELKGKHLQFILAEFFLST